MLFIGRSKQAKILRSCYPPFRSHQGGFQPSNSPTKSHPSLGPPCQHHSLRTAGQEVFGAHTQDNQFPEFVNQIRHEYCQARKEFDDFRGQAYSLIPLASRMYNYARARSFPTIPDAIEQHDQLFMSGVFYLWHQVAKMFLPKRAMRRIYKQHADVVRNWKVDQFQRAHRRNDSRSMWHFARSLVGVAKGSRRRWGRATITSHPTMQSTKRMLQKLARHEGWGAIVFKENTTSTPIEAGLQICRSVVEMEKDQCYPTTNPNYDIKDTNADITEFRRLIKRDRNGKTPPFWSFPTERLKILCNPQTVTNPPKCGLGHTAPFLPTTCILACPPLTLCVHCQNSCPTPVCHVPDAQIPEKAHLPLWRGKRRV